MKTIETGRIIRKRVNDDTLYGELRAALGSMCQILSSVHIGAVEPMSSDLTCILSSGGKLLRPILAYMCCSMGAKREKNIIPLMCMLELMHTASLIHDDVVDKADRRRNIPTINSIRGDGPAVQSGDFLLARAMELLGIYKGTGINEMLAEVSYRMAVGELEQQELRYEFGSQSKEAYFSLIYKKTAALLAASCYCGAIAGGMQPGEAQTLYRYGENLGIAFQIRDDLIDYSEMHSDKAPGQDMRNGIFTLPVLILLDNGVPENIRSLLKKRGKTGDEVQSLMEYVRSSGVLAQTEQTLSEYCRKSENELGELRSCHEKKALTELVVSIAQRIA